MAGAFDGSNAGAGAEELVAGQTTGVATLRELFWSLAPNAAVGAQVTPAIDIRNSATAALSDRRADILSIATDPPPGEARRAECMTPPITFFPARLYRRSAAMHRPRQH